MKNGRRHVKTQPGLSYISDDDLQPVHNWVAQPSQLVELMPLEKNTGYAKVLCSLAKLVARSNELPA